MKKNIQAILLFTIILLCFVGKGILESIGYLMGEYATSNLTKIHPVTYIVLFLIVLTTIVGDFGYIKTLLRSKGERFYFFSIIAILLYLVLSGNSASMSSIIDTLLIPVFFFAFFKSTPVSVQEKGKNLALILILANSGLAIFERLETINVFPILTSYGSLFRSTALLGHPLNNALITLIFVLYVLSIELTSLTKNIYLAILFTALICFGARGAMYVGALSIFLLYLIPTFFYRNRYFLKSSKFSAILLITIAVVGIVYIIQYTTFGERLTQVSYFDESANVRLQALTLIDFNSLTDYLWAKSVKDMNFLASEQGIEIIENFLVIWILRFGLIFTGLLLYALFYYLISISQVKNRKMMFLIVGLFITGAVTNNSLAGSTEALVLITLLFGFKGKKYVF